jgi:nucleoid DNA-binding protein
MPVQYNVDSNLLTDPPSHYPRVAPIATLDLDAIASLINLHNTNVPTGTAKMCINLFIEEVKTQLAEGNWVKLDNFCSFSTSIVNGSLENPGDTLPGTAKVELRFKPSAPFKLGVQELATFERLGYTNKAPQIVGVSDVDLSLSKVARNGMPVNISGTNIGFNSSAADEGIFMLTDGGAETKVSVVARNKPSNVIVVPTITASADGETATIIYSRSRYTTNGQLKQGAFQYVRIPNTIASSAVGVPMLKPYGAAAAISATVPAGPITGLLTMKITPQGDVVAYAQELVDGVLDANEGEVTIVEGVNTVVLAGEDFLLGVGSLATLTSQLEAEGRFVQELIVVEEAA